MKEHARVCIIGGGIFGVSILYHLTLEGWTDVVLVEKGELTSGSTWHAAGQVPNFVASLNMAKIHDYGVNLYPKLQEETGSPVSWHGCGGIRLALTDEEVDWFKYVEGVSKLIGYEMHLIGVDEIKARHPFIETFGVKMGAYTVNDGHVDPSSITSAMAIGARKRGAEIYRHTQATNVKQLPSGEWQVTTDKGTIVCEHVVNAAGCYGHEICKWVGLQAPIVNMVHQYIVTESVKEIEQLDYELPVIRDPYSDSYLRQEQNGILVGPYETTGAKVCFEDNGTIPPWSFDMELFEPDLDRIMPWLERATERFPLFGQVGIKSVVNGPIAHTPDDNFLLGPTQLKNFWMACGSSIGICQGGGAGKYFSQWMVHGQADINMAEFDPRRFGDWVTHDYAVEKAVDAYQHMYYLHIPGEYRDVARGQRTSALYNTLNDKGAVNMVAFGWERPKWYAPDGVVEKYDFRRSNAHEYVGEECKAAQNDVITIDISSFAKFDVTGKDSEAFLNRITANKMPRREGGVTLTHFINENAIIEGEATISKLADNHYYILVGAGAEVHDFSIMDKALQQNEDVQITNITDDYGALLVAGPKSRDVLKTITDASLESPEFKWLTGKNISIAGISVRALRVNYIGELGWELHCKMQDLHALYQAVMQAGADKGIRDAGYYAMNSMRMEKAYRGMGSELTNELTLIEADMERFIGWDKQDFIGKKALEQRKKDGPNIQLVYLELDECGADCLGNEPIYSHNKLVGVTTSGAYGHRVGKSLAFGYVTPALANVGEEFDIILFSERVRATVLGEAAYDPNNDKLRS